MHSHNCIALLAMLTDPDWDDDFDLDDMLDLRKDTNGACTRFCADLLPGSVTHNRSWLSLTATTTITKGATSVEEAFGLLELCNNWEVWCEIAEKKADNPGLKDSELGLAKKPRWTFRGPGEESSAMVEGWKREGHSEFNKLHGRVLEDRASELGKEFERKFQETQRAKDAELNGKRGRKRKNNNSNRDDVVPAANLLDSSVAQRAQV